jgi:TRAP-type C4-dicarboxylate transport system permease small subunit
VLDRILAHILEGFVILLATVIVSVVTTDVTLRYLFGRSLVITQELSRYLMVWIVFLGSALAIRDNSHIRISVLVNRMPATLKFFIELLSDISILVFCAVLIFEGIRILPAQFQENTTTLPVTMFWFYLPIPLGTFFMVIFLILKIRQAFRERSGKCKFDHRQPSC